MEFARQVSAIAALTSFQYMDSSSLKEYKQINPMQYAHDFVVHYNAQISWIYFCIVITMLDT